MKSEKKQKEKTPVSELDAITVDGNPFIAQRLVSAIVDRVNYLDQRCLRHEISLVRQGDVISDWKKLAQKQDKFIDAKERMMQIAENAIIYWERAYHSVFSWFRISVISLAIVGAALLTMSWVCYNYMDAYHSGCPNAVTGWCDAALGIQIPSSKIPEQTCIQDK